MMGTRLRYKKKEVGPTITQRSIAEELNLSIATVSRALMSDPAIRAHTRAAVLSTAARLGYRKTTTIARVERSPLRRRMGILAYDNRRAGMHRRDVLARLLAGMGEGARDIGASLALEYFTNDVSDHLHEPDHLPACVRDRDAEGLLLCGPVGDASVAYFSGLMPCVRLAYHDRSVSLNCVDHDDFRSVSQLLEHLFGLGHARVGFMHSTRTRSFNRARLGAYVEAISAEPNGFDPTLVVESPGHTPDCFATAAKRVADLCRAGVTAWICANDDIGYDLLAAIGELGLVAPRDLSVVGFDNWAAPAGLPKLTSIEAPFEDMGRAAVRILGEALDAPRREPVRMLMTTKLVVGDSAGPPPRAG